MLESNSIELGFQFSQFERVRIPRMVVWTDLSFIASHAMPSIPTLLQQRGWFAYSTTKYDVCDFPS